MPSQESEPLYGGRRPGRVTVRDIAAAKARGEKWPMLTTYDALTAGIFDEAGIPVLLVGDSAGNVVFGYDTTIPVTVDELIPLTAAVVRGTSRAMVVADLPFGSYQASPTEALHAAVRFMKEAGAHAIKLEGGQRIAHHVEYLVWQDMAGLSARSPKFVKRYADLAGVLRTAASEFAAEVAGGTFPSEEYSYK
jgi:3-methyl-2-oxobutanoate hydroxymethyltransferase